MIYTWGNCYRTGCKALATTFQQIVGLLSIPWGNTVHWNILCDSFKLMEGIEKANIGWSSGYKGIVKKQSLGSVTNKCQFLGIILGVGRPGCKVPIGTITALTALKSVSIFYLPDFFCITNTGEFQGLKDSIICPLLSCSLINLCKASNFSCFRSHCSIHRRRQWHPTLVLLPGKSHGQRILEGCSPWGRWGSDKTEWLHFHFSLSSIGDGNGSPLQCSCLENPRDGGAGWAAVYGVAQSQTRLKWLSSSSSIHTGWSVFQLRGIGVGGGRLIGAVTTSEKEKWKKVKVKSLSRVWFFVTPWTVTYEAPSTMGFSGKNAGVGCYFLLQWIFPTQGSNPGLLHCRQMLYHLSHQLKRGWGGLKSWAFKA